MVFAPTRYAVIVVGLVALTSAVYLPTLGYPFVYEDANWLQMLPNDLPVRVEARPGRALTHLTYQWTYAWAPFDPAPWRAGNLLLHLVNGVLLYRLGTILAGQSVGLVAALLLLLHPLTSQAVLYISARGDLLMSTWILLAALVALGRTYVALRGAACLAVLLAAAWTKEIGIVGVPLVLMTLLVWRRQSMSAFGPSLAVLWIGCGAILGVLWTQIQAWLTLSSSTNGASVSAATYAWLQLGLVGQMAGMVARWEGLSLDHDALAITDGVRIMTVMGVGVAVATLWFARRHHMAVWSLAWIGIGLIPRVLVPTNEFLSEHHVYVVLIGAWIGLASAARAIACGTLTDIVYMHAVSAVERIWSGAPRQRTSA